jgi:hypothetical protein
MNDKKIALQNNNEIYKNKIVRRTEKAVLSYGSEVWIMAEHNRITDATDVNLL